MNESTRDSRGEEIGRRTADRPTSGLDRRKPWQTGQLSIAVEELRSAVTRNQRITPSGRAGEQVGGPYHGASRPLSSPFLAEHYLQCRPALLLLFVTLAAPPERDDSMANNADIDDPEKGLAGDREELARITYFLSNLLTPSPLDLQPLCF